MDQALVSLASGRPLIDIDLTVLVQFGLFLLLFLVANKLLFQPYLRLRKLREQNIEGARAEADRMITRADATLANYEKQLAAARDRAGDEGRKVRAAAAAHEKEVTDKARADAQKTIDEATARMRQEADAARLQLLPQANQLARTITGKLLGREVS
jgi:F-type H+-transporting ATPase subunit b